MGFGLFQFRRGTATQWSTANTVLADGELGLETDTDQFKIGDGTTAWNSLPYGGIQGPQGAAGRGIVSVTRTAGTGAAGTTDTYTITYTTGPTSTFTVTNGADGNTPTVTVGATTTVTPAAGPSVADADAGANVDLRFSLPRARNLSVAATNTLTSGSPATVTSATDGNGDVALTFGIPQGPAGPTGPTGPTGPAANSFTNIAGNTGTAVAEVASDTLSILGSTGISTVASDASDTLTITNTDRGSVAVAPIKNGTFYAEDFGTLTSGTNTGTVAGAQATTNAATIQAAVNAAKAAGGGDVILPDGCFHIDATITIDASNVRLIGKGAYGNTDAAGIAQASTGTALFWNNTASGATVAMIDVVSPSGSTLPAVKNSGVKGLSLQCAGNVGIGLRVRSIHWGQFRDIYVINPSSQAVRTECLVTGTTLGEAADVTKCTFDDIRVRLLESPAGAVGFSLDGASNANTSNSTFRNLAVSCQGDQLALDIRNTDSNRFYDVAVNQSNGGTVQPVRLRGGTAAGLEARGNAFYYLAPGGSSTGLRGVYVEGTETAGVTAPAVNNRAFGYSIENGEPMPTVGTGAAFKADPVGGTFSNRSRVALPAPISNVTETIVGQWLLPARALQQGMFIPINFTGGVTAFTAAGTLTMRVRIGTVGTVAGDTQVITWGPSANTAANVQLTTLGTGLVVLTSAGTSATVQGSGGFALGTGVVHLPSAAPATATVNPSVPLFVSLTFQFNGGTQTFTPRYTSLGALVMP